MTKNGYWVLQKIYKRLYNLKGEKKIIVSGSCVTGLSHLKKKIPCHDRILTKTSNGTTVIALADGAGSYLKPELGAETVNSYVCDYIVRNFSALYSKSNEEIAKELLIGMREKLIDKAKSLELNVKDLSSTILFVGVNNGRYLAGHIGDGMIGYYERNKALPLSYPDNDNEYTIFPMNKGVLKRFRIYKNDLNKINGFILMSDGTYDSLYNPKTKQLTDANNTMLEWMQDQNYSDIKVESEIENTIREFFLKNSVNGDDCSVNILAITDEKVYPKEIRKIDMKQVNDNTQRIKQLSATVDSIKTKIENVENELSVKVNKNELGDKLKGSVHKNEVNQLKSEFDKIKSKVKEQGKKVKKNEDSLSSTNAQLTKYNDSLKKANGKDLIAEFNALLKWKKNTQTLLIILFLLCAGLTGFIIKLFLSFG